MGMTRVIPTVCAYETQTYWGQMWVDPQSAKESCDISYDRSSASQRITANHITIAKPECIKSTQNELLTQMIEMEDTSDAA